jgi:hypothetical protein
MVHIPNFKSNNYWEIVHAWNPMKKPIIVEKWLTPNTLKNYNHQSNLYGTSSQDGQTIFKFQNNVLKKHWILQKWKLKKNKNMNLDIKTKMSKCMTNAFFF